MEYTPEQAEDFQTRATAFGEDFQKMYAELKEKHQCEMKHGVSTVPSPSGIFGLAVNEQIADLKYAPKPSPFVPTAEGGVEEAK